MKWLFRLISALLLLPFCPHPAQVLEVLNRAREALALPRLAALPTGNPGDPRGCPIARSIGAMVGADALCFWDADEAHRVAGAWHTTVQRHENGSCLVRPPQVICRFVRDYDLGAYPALKHAHVR